MSPMRADPVYTWTTAVEFVSSILAYFVSFRLVSELGIGFTIGDSGGTPMGPQGWLSLGLALTWSVLFPGWNAAVSKNQSRPTAIWRMLRAELIFLGILGSGYLTKFMSRGLVVSFVLGSLLYLPVSLLLRRIVLYITRFGSSLTPGSQILVIGSKCRAREVIRAINNAAERYKILGCLDPDASLAGGNVEGAKILGPTEMLPHYLFSHHVDLIVVALPLELVPNAKSMIDTAIIVGVPVAVVPDFYVQKMGHEMGRRDDFLESMLGAPAAILSTVPRNTTYLVWKRLLDIFVSAFLLVLLSPLFLVIAILVKLSPPQGPVFYPWEVLGRNRRPFVGYKFRTMVPDADKLKMLLLKHNEMQGPVFKMRNDPRVTPLGRCLRKHSLDELPQLYSVLKGDMSLVGPRPPGKEEAELFEFWQHRKLSVTPGITCLWQVNGRSNIKSFDEWARLDLQYISSASLWLDFMILLKTVPAVMHGRGAH
jgi:exopolysaccharide biosynthesis polyprenyl glycosylphosphotransferase